MNLRPEKFDDIIGQESVKKCLSISIDSAKKRGDVLNHSLFLGSAGTGKTTLALVTAKELGSNILLANGGGINKLKDILPYLIRMKEGDVLFIDEVHRINRKIQELLYTVLEDFRLDISKGCKSMYFPRFTMVGATTEAGMLLRPFYDRFINKVQLEDYTIEELSSIIKINSDKIKINITDDAIKNIAKRSRFTPRIANSLLQWCRDYAVSTDSNIDDDVVNKSMKLKKIDSKGLDLQDYKYLRVLKRANKPLGLNTLVASSGLSKETVEQQVEPFLLKLNIIEKSSRGRILV